MRLAAVLTVAAVVLAGCGGAKQPTMGLSAHGSRSEVTIGQPVTISGVVRRAGKPVSLNLDLRASTAPLYNDVHRVARTRSSSHGEFGFVVRPQKNTAYTVATSGAARNVVVFAAPRYGLKYTRAASGAIAVAFTVEHPAALKPTARRVYFYAGQKGVGKLMRVGDARLVATSPTRALASGTFGGAPAGPIDAFACLRTEIAPGYGAPPVKGCGGPSLSR
jgi:hypothetical protein